MELTQKPRAIEGLEIRVVGGEWLVHDPTNGKVHVLNESAGEILKLCDGDRTYDDIAKSLSDGTGADSKQVADDVALMIRQFTELGLVR
jgi:PqqD family protein of HPr-rel-A system